MILDHASLERALQTLGEVLAARGEQHDLAVVGGGALLILGLIARPTRDLDVVARIDEEQWSRAEPFPPALSEAVRDVAGALDLIDLGLPEGFAERTMVRRYGTLTVRFAARVDQIAFKLYAAVDQGPDSKHFADLEKLAPTSDELLAAARWARTHDPSDGFRSMLHQALRALGVEPSNV